jgi:type VI secretion system protein ImpJ
MMQTKLSSVEIIRDLVSRGIPGVPLAALAIAPRQIPYHANFAYFRIDQQHDLWQQIIKTGSVALHVSGQFPNLRLELWAIRG